MPMPASRRLQSPGVVPVAAIALMVLLTGALSDSYEMRLLAIAGCHALMVLGYQLVFGHAGALSLAQGTFFGLGALITGMLANGPAGGPLLAPLYSLPLAVAGAVLLALLVALPVLRLASHYFALATLGVGQVVWLWALTAEDFTGGANGIGGIVAPVQGFGLLALVWLAVVLVAWVNGRIAGGLRAVRFAMIREDPLAAAAIGIDAGRLRLLTFLTGAAWGGMGGAFLAPVVGVVSAADLAFPVMVVALAMTVVGGRLHPAGGVAAALLLIHLPEWARPLGEWRLFLHGALLLATILLFPAGLGGLVQGLWRRRFPPPVGPPPRQTALTTPAPDIPVGDDRESSTAGKRDRAPRLMARSQGSGRDRPAIEGQERITPILEVRGLVRRYGGVAAADGIDLTIARGEVLGIAGPNGAGKTTLANLVAGAGRPDSGSIRIAGRETTGWPAWRIARLGVGRSFQVPRLVPDMTVLDAVAVAVAGDPRSGDPRAGALALLDRLEATALAARPCESLSRGQRRRVEMARALALDPVLLLLDEPSAGLDVAGRETLARLILSLAGDGLAILVIDHDGGFLDRVASRRLWLESGRIGSGPENREAAR